METYGTKKHICVFYVDRGSDQPYRILTTAQKKIMKIVIIVIVRAGGSQTVRAAAKMIMMTKQKCGIHTSSLIGSALLPMLLDETMDEVITTEATDDDDEYQLFLQKEGEGKTIPNPSTRVQALVAASCILIISCLL